MSRFGVKFKRILPPTEEQDSCRTYDVKKIRNLTQTNHFKPVIIPQRRKRRNKETKQKENKTEVNKNSNNKLNVNKQTEAGLRSRT